MTMSVTLNASAAGYRVYGHLLSCTEALPELEPVSAHEAVARPDIEVRWVDGPDRFDLPLSWFLTIPSTDNTPWMLCGKCSDGYVLRFPDLADFCVDRSGQRILCAPTATTPRPTVRHLLLDQVLPLALNQRGCEALHATAVVTAQGACAFVGPTGSGKSTLAASFALLGAPVLSDDCLLIEEQPSGIVAFPGYPGVRLWNDTVEALFSGQNRSVPVAHYTTKRRMAFDAESGQFSSAPAPLSRIYILLPDSPSRLCDDSFPSLITPLAPRDVLMALIGSAFRLDITDRHMMVRQLQFFARVHARIPVRGLTLPDSYEALPAVCTAIVQDLRS
ncbi:MAG: hypothetical protein CAF44_014950 [Nitrospira sp. CG24D]|nr:MAG: hypothetical protein CAF44_014950 [Nitrospira sp. CG24D]